VATKHKVEAKLRELIARLSGTEAAQDKLARSLPESKVIAVIVPDLDSRYWATMEGGRMDGLHQGVPERADITIRIGSDDLVSVADGATSFFSAFVSGRIKVEASVSDLLRLRRLT
jgi:putative sterol carrier protein